MPSPDPAQHSVRVLTICGSRRQGSANRALVDVVTQRARATGVVVEAFDGLFEIGPFDPEFADRPGDAVTHLRERVGRADAVVIAAPEYAGALAGVMKNALDWLVGSGDMWDRTVGVACAGTTGGWFARRDLAQTLAWQGGLVVAHLGISSPITKSDGQGRFDDTATIHQIDRFTDRLLESITVARSERIRRARAVATEFGLDALRVAGGADE